MAKNLGKMLILGAVFLASLLVSQYHVNKIDDLYVDKMRKYRHQADSVLNSDTTKYKYCESAKRISEGRDQAIAFAMDNPPYTIHDSRDLEAQMDSFDLFVKKIFQRYEEDKKAKEKIK